MDAKEIGQRIASRLCGLNGLNIPGTVEWIALQVVEEIEKAQTPKTRGEMLAEQNVFIGSNGRDLGLVLKPYSSWRLESLAVSVEPFRKEFACLIDAERASAVAEYRERLAAKFDQLGNQAAADVVRE